MMGRGSLPQGRDMRLGQIYDLSHTLIPGKEEYRVIVRGMGKER